jgi:hypothetical protein
MEEQIIINKHINDESDSIDLGTAGKSGCVKVYFNANKPDEAKVKIDNALLLRKYMNEQAKLLEPTQ